MTEIDDIKNFMRGKDKVRLEDIYCLPIKSSLIRSILRTNIKKNINFELIRKGFYKLKD